MLSKVEVMTIFPACSFLENIYNEYTKAYKMIVENLSKSRFVYDR